MNISYWTLKGKIRTGPLLFVRSKLIKVKSALWFLSGVLKPFEIVRGKKNNLQDINTAAEDYTAANGAMFLDIRQM